MKLLERQPEAVADAPPEPPVEAPPEEAPREPDVRTCTSCGAAMEPGQDWCLACGTAAGRLATRPGARSMMAVLGLTGLLVVGAVAASYAALREDRTIPPTQTAAQSQVAQAPPPAATTAPPAATTTTPTTSTGTTGTGSGKLPKVQVPSSSASTPAPAPAPIPTPAPSTPRVTPTPSTGSSGSSGSTGSSGSSSSSGSSGSAGSSGSSGSGTSTTTTPKPKPSAPVAIDLPATAASVYDPYSRATAVGVPGKALDGDGSTSWFVDTAAGSSTVAVGYVVNLGELRGTRSIDITTPTPGFTVEIYESDQPTPPPAITDTRWAHVTDKADVGDGGTTHIVLGAGSSKYQTLLIWITKPPSDGTRVRISELKVFG